MSSRVSRNVVEGEVTARQVSALWTGGIWVTVAQIAQIKKEKLGY